MKKYFLLIFFLIIVSQQGLRSETLIKSGEMLSLQKCVNIALKKHPSIIAARNSVSASASRVGQAQSSYFPQIAGSAGYNISGYSGNISQSSRQPDTFTNSDQFSAGLSLNQMIFDFGKTPAQVSMQKYNLGASRADFDSSHDLIIYNVKIAYYGLLQSMRNRDVALETVNQYNQRLDLVKGFFEVSLKPRSEVTKAEVDLSNARLSLIKAENALKLAQATLNNTMGMSDAPDYKIEDNLAFEKKSLSYDKSLAAAFKNRPDFRSQQYKTKSIDESVNLAIKGYFPVLSGNASYSWSWPNASFPNSNYQLSQNWYTGLAVLVPIFNGLLTARQIEEARANLRAAKANEDLIRQQIILDVKQAHIKMNEAEESIPATELALKQATENLDLANGRYKAGLGSIIDVTDAQILYINARTNYIQALYNYKVALASLDKATGAK